MLVIDRFIGEYRFLSNFYPADVELDGDLYSTVEHAYQAAKMQDLNDRRVIQKAATPGQAKRLGRSVCLREDWLVVRINIMRNLVNQKFMIPHLRKLLLEKTGDAVLQEGNTWGDRFWGVCRGEGENWLGKILMEVRTSLS